MDNDLVKESALLWLLWRRRRRLRRTRRFRVHPLWQRRREQGVHENLFKEMVIFDHAMFRSFIRMTVEDYEKLLVKIGPDLVSAATRKDLISPSEKLLVTLRYLAAGESISSLSKQFRTGVSTIDTVIPKGLKILWEKLQPDVLQMPEAVDDWQNIVNGFDTKWQFPHCWGALDGKQIVMTAQSNTGSEFYNYKHTHSITLLAVCDAEYRFTIVDIGAKGRQSDGGVLRHSNFGQRLFSRSLNLPEPTELFPDSTLVPYFCVADEAFPLDINIMRPYPGRSTGRLGNDEKIFNYRLSRARRVIENTFGILSSNWRIFRIPINASLDNIKLTVLGAVCLHNFLRREELQLPEDMQYYCSPNSVDRVINGVELLGEWRNDFRMDALQPLSFLRNENLSAVMVRETLKNYFNNEGQVPWQQERVNQGTF